MGSQIIQQPNGQFAVFSSITDTIHIRDATAQEIVDYFVEKTVEDVKRQLAEILVNVAAGEPRKSYHQFAMTWEEALARDYEHGGEVWLAMQAERKTT